MDSFSYRVFTFSRQNGLIQPGERLIVSLSGGIDSMSLFCLLHSFSKQMALDLHLVHFNHGLREESLEEEDFLRDLANQKGVPITVFSSTSLKGTSGIQQKARDWRNDCLIEVLKEQKFDKIALGHHLDDLVETQIWRMLRGASLFSLNPIQESSPPYIRPLLRFRKQDLENYLLSINQEWCQDRSNFENDYTRNIIRNQLIPVMEEQAGGRLVDKMLALNDDAYQLKLDFENQVPAATIESEELGYQSILSLSPVFAKELIHRFLLHHGQTEITRTQIEDIHKLVKLNQGNWQIGLKQDKIITGRDKTVFISQRSDV